MKMKNKLSSFELKSKFDAGAIPFPEDFHQIINESGKINDLLKVDEIFHTDAEGRLTIPVEKDSGLFISEGLLSVNLKENGGGEFNSDGFLTVKEGDSVSFDDFFLLTRAERIAVSHYLHLSDVVTIPHGFEGSTPVLSICGNYILLYLLKENYLDSAQYSVCILKENDGRWERWINSDFIVGAYVPDPPTRWWLFYVDDGFFLIPGADAYAAFGGNPGGYQFIALNSDGEDKYMYFEESGEYVRNGVSVVSQNGLFFNRKKLGTALSPFQRNNVSEEWVLRHRYSEEKFNGNAICCVSNDGFMEAEYIFNSGVIRINFYTENNDVVELNVGEPGSNGDIAFDDNGDIYYSNDVGIFFMKRNDENWSDKELVVLFDKEAKYTMLNTTKRCCVYIYKGGVTPRITYY